MPQSIEEVTALRVQLWDGGYRPIPVFNADAKVSSPGKQPLGDRWREEALKDPPLCAQSLAVAWALNTGLLCDGLRAIDIDVDDPAIAARCRAIAVDRFGEAPIRMRRNSARCLILYRAASGAPPKIAITGAEHAKGNALKIEALGAGQQFVAFGTHDSGADLEWFPEGPDQVEAGKLPAVTEDGLLAFFETIAPILGASAPSASNGHDHYTTAEPQAAPLRVAGAVAAIPNGSAPDWEFWNNLGMAVWAATGGSQFGGELFNEWSKRNPAYDAAATEERWKHYQRSPPTRIGAGSLFHLAANVRGIQRPEEEPPAWLDEAPQWDSIEGEAEDATIPPADKKPPEPFPATPITERELAIIPPRELVYGHFLFRKFVSALGAPGGSGKTAYAYTVALALASRRDYLSEGVYDPGNVWIYNLEDPRTELLRRLKAAMIGHDVTFADIEDRLFLDSGRDRPLVIAKVVRDGTVVAWPQVPALIDEIKARNIHLLVVDPFVRSHRVEENHNDQIDFVVALWAQIADAADCAILLVHHFRKGGLSGDAAAFRGASALIDASRAAVTLAAMTADEALKLGIPEKERWQYVRVDNAKLNLAPPPSNALWLKLSGVCLDNATPERQADNVQTVKRWAPTSAWEGISWDDIESILDAMERGMEDGEFYALGRQSGDRWAGHLIVTRCGKAVGHATQILKKWKDNAVIEDGQYASPRRKGALTACVRANKAKLAEFRSASSNLPEFE